MNYSKGYLVCGVSRNTLDIRVNHTVIVNLIMPRVSNMIVGVLKSNDF